MVKNKRKVSATNADAGASAATSGEGTDCGPYATIEEVGQGTFSKVTKSFDRSNRRLVAIKTLLSEPDASRLRAVAREIEILTRLNSDENSRRGAGGVKRKDGMADNGGTGGTGEEGNGGENSGGGGHGKGGSTPKFIVTMYGHFTVGDRPHLILEYLTYDLRHVLHRKKSLSQRDVLVIGRALLLALELLRSVSNSAPIVHGDLKPENVMVDRSGHVKLVDFGGSFYEEEGRTHSVCGTRAYRAPEVIMHDSFDGAIDVWSAGCIVAECSQGRRLFDGKRDCRQIHAIAESLGTPPQDLIRSSSRRDEYFRATEDGSWTFKEPADCGRPVAPGSRPLLPGLVSSQKTSHKSLLRDVLVKMLDYDPRGRIRPDQALKHPVFSNAERLELRIDMRGLGS